MAIAQSDRQSIRIKPEATYGAVAATGNYYGLRFTSESLKYNVQRAKSQEIVDSRAVRDLITTDANAEGSISAEFVYGEYDSLIQAALATVPQNVVGTNGAATGTGTFTATGLTITGASSPFTNCVSGQWIGVSGAVNSANNKLVQITAASATGITVASGTFTAETGSTGVVVSGTRYLNGQSKKSFSIERYNPDLSTGGLYECMRGMVVDKWSLNMQPGSIITQQFDFVGKDALAMSASTAMPGTGVASLTNRIMNSVVNISDITEGGVVLSNTYAKNIQLNTMNNIDGLDAIGSLGNVDFRLGEFSAQLKMDLYLADATYYNKFLNNTPSTFSARLTDASGNAYVVTIPAARYTTGERPNGGRNQTLMVNLGVEAVLDTTTNAALIIDRCGTAVTPWA